MKFPLQFDPMVARLPVLPVGECSSADCYQVDTDAASRASLLLTSDQTRTTWTRVKINFAVISLPTYDLKNHIVNTSVQYLLSLYYLERHNEGL